MQKIIALFTGFILAVCLAVVGFTSPAQAVTCVDKQTAWHTSTTGYYSSGSTQTVIGVALRYKQCSDNTVKATAIGGYYNLGVDYMDCSDNFGSDFTGVTYDFANRGDDIIGGVDPAPRKQGCWPSGKPGPQWWDISGQTTKVNRSNVWYAFYATMTINRTINSDPQFQTFGWPV